MTKADIWRIALYIRLARPRPGFWRLARMTPEKLALGVDPWVVIGFSKESCAIGMKAMTERSSEGLDVRRRKLLFRAWRRGVREMDLIVGRFADAYIDKFDEPTLDEFERLIEVPNAELYAWVVGDAVAPASYDTPVLRQLIDFHMGAEAER